MNNKVLLGSLLLVFFACLPSLSAARAQVKSIHWTDTPRARLLVDFSGQPTYKLTRSAAPPRLTIEVSDTALPPGLSQPPANHPIAARIGSLPGKAPNSLRLRVDLKNPAVPHYHIENQPEGVRMVVEWSPVPPAAPPQSQAQAQAKPVASQDGRKPSSAAKPKPPAAFVVAIDAGHGGKDTGAIGPNGVLEKDVVLAIARKLAGFIRAEPGMKAVMVRASDQFVDLRQRAEIARKAHADLFVSLHADAYENNDVRGSSVFTLSDHGASSEAARWLADSENVALVDGVKLKDKGKTLASVLVDLSKNATQEASDKAAGKVLRELRKDFEIHHEAVQKAGFVVLKSLDVPSMLVETAFISNPDEERNLNDAKHQERIARAVFKGIRAYFVEARPALPSAVRVAEADKN
ncbi:N-acetylmuramoyl-L-alanine amidase [Methylomagnum sp.]